MKQSFYLSFVDLKLLQLFLAIFLKKIHFSYLPFLDFIFINKCFNEINRMIKHTPDNLHCSFVVELKFSDLLK